jgi:hypothetical protein
MTQMEFYKIVQGEGLSCEAENHSKTQKLINLTLHNLKRLYFKNTTGKFKIPTTK